MNDTKRTGIECDSESGESSLAADQDVAIAVEKPAAVRTKGAATVEVQAGSHRPRDADDGAIHGNQDCQSGLPSFLPDGRFLRTVLRGR